MEKQEPLMVFVLGTTNTGKTTFLNQAADLDSRFGKIMVGKEMRKRYPPGFFQGLGAMPSTEDEAIEIFHQQLQAEKSEGKDIILVDGQPRTPKQVELTESFPNRLYIFLHEDEEVIKERMVQRAAGDEEELKMSAARYDTDQKMLYEVFIHLKEGWNAPSIISVTPRTVASEQRTEYLVKLLIDYKFYLDSK